MVGEIFAAFVYQLHLARPRGHGEGQAVAFAQKEAVDVVGLVAGLRDAHPSGRCARGVSSTRGGMLSLFLSLALAQTPTSDPAPASVDEAAEAPSEALLAHRGPVVFHVEIPWGIEAE